MLRELFFPLGYNDSPPTQWPVYVGGLGFVLDFGPVFMSSQSACFADSFHLTSLSCGFPCVFTQVEFSLRLVYRTSVAPEHPFPRTYAQRKIYARACPLTSAPLSCLPLVVDTGETYLDFHDRHIPSHVELPLSIF